MAQQPQLSRDPISFMTRHRVAANLLFLFIVSAGTLAAFRVKQEIFPEFETDLVTISIAYPGASPEEVEKGVVIPVEEAVRGLDYIDEVTSVSMEGSGVVTVELAEGANPDKMLSDIKVAVDRIVTFPEQAERPVVSLVTTRREVMDLVIYGDVDELSLRSLAQRVRDELLLEAGIAQAELRSTRNPEVSIEVSREALRKYGLTLDTVAAIIRGHAREVPLGLVRTPYGEVLLRVSERREFADQFMDVPIVAGPAGSVVRLRDIATVREGFEDVEKQAWFNGKPAMVIKVYAVGEQSPVELASTVRAFVDRVRPSLPKGVRLGVWMDWSEYFRERMNLLLRNALIGFMLVLLVLGVFLEARLAFWVAMGIPVSFLGAIFLFPGLKVSINMVTMFAFMVSLGMVVDDATVVGEHVFRLRQEGMPAVEAAIKGAKGMSVPVFFAVATTIVAFLPLLTVPGPFGKLFRMIPLTVCTVLTVSFLEAMLVFPSHVAHSNLEDRHGFFKVAALVQRWFDARLQAFTQRHYRRVLSWCLRHKATTIAATVAVSLATVGFVAGGHIDFTFMPRIDSDVVQANVVMPFGAPIEDTKAAVRHIEKALRGTIAEVGGDKVVRGVFASVGEPVQKGAAHSILEKVSEGSHLGGVMVYLVPSDERPFTATQFANMWREKVGRMPGVDTLTFKSTIGPAAGAALDIRLSHWDVDVLERAARELAAELARFKGVKDIDDGVEPGKPQLDLHLTEEGRSAGLTVTDLSRQVRGAFYGAEALRIQRGEDEVKVMVRLPKGERRSLADIRDLVVRAPSGGEMPLFRAASVRLGHSYTSIRRANGRRTVDVTADVLEPVANPLKIRKALEAGFLPRLRARHPGLAFEFVGEQKEMKKSMDALKRAFMVALLGIFVLLALEFQSYSQPVLVMVVIPLGFVGVVIAHVMLGYNLSLVSMLGLVALSGVVVNDSLLFVHTANACLRSGEAATPMDAALKAGVRRIRPIVLTSVTTFFGIAPLILESSVQARFMIPMAISLGFGVLFATLITLLVLPVLYTTLGVKVSAR